MRIGTYIIGDEILSGKRADKHLARVITTLGGKGLKLDWARYEGDDRAHLTAALAQSFAARDIVFSFGGIGATPDDHTRQAAAAALHRPLERQPEALALIEGEFGDAAYPYRVLMAEFPAGARIIPNPVNRIAGFSIDDHHFFPGFPQMAWPMLDWVLATHYGHLTVKPQAEKAILVYGAGESMLLPLMNDNVARFPNVSLFSLPAFDASGGRKIELGVKGAIADLDAAIEHLRTGVTTLGFRWEALPDRRLGEAPSLGS